MSQFQVSRFKTLRCENLLPWGYKLRLKFIYLRLLNRMYLSVIKAQDNQTLIVLSSVYQCHVIAYCLTSLYVVLWFHTWLHQSSYSIAQCLWGYRQVFVLKGWATFKSRYLCKLDMLDFNILKMLHRNQFKLLKSTSLNTDNLPHKSSDLLNLLYIWNRPL